jgi:hypothetical protein
MRFKRYEPEVVIDLTGFVEEAPSRQEWGQPGPCPRCHGPGYLDHIDLRRRVTEQHCPGCGFRWTISEEDLHRKA